MKKVLLLILLALFTFGGTNAQGNAWSKISKDRVSSLDKVDRASMPVQFETYSLDFPALKSALQAAPSRDSGVSTQLVSFPNPDGKMEKFAMYQTQVMHPELAARHPDIKTYIGKGIDDPNATINISTTLYGFHGMTLTSEKGTWYIDPYTKDLGNYIVYQKKDLVYNSTTQCLVVDEPRDASQEVYVNPEMLRASDGKFRTYRLAMACTIEYAAYHVSAAGVGTGTLAQKKAAVMAAMVVSMVRINGIYERDMSLTMQFVANNDSIIFITSDNFSNANANALINESQTVIDGAIGSANYDIGHTVSTGGGGLAQSPSVCLSGKARGITGSPAPVGDPFDIDFVAHEMGHQFGASHTFNGLGGNCTTSTRANAFAVEPGSGTTIMAYAGICAAQDVQPHSDDHFHAVSIGQMVAHVLGGGSCAVSVLNGNASPVVDAGADYFIPKGTAFVLKGSATDTDGDSLTYCWEQTDNQTLGVTQPPIATNIAGPNYRSRTPMVSPNRYMPRIQDVIAGNLTPKWEVTPSVPRVLGFALTVRDNRSPNGGQTGRDNTIITVTNSGPFGVTSQNTDQLVLPSGSAQTVTWNVASTTAAPISTANVNIMLSTDGGLTFPTMLAANTPNDGTEIITLPNITQPNCRIIVEAVGNIFYAMNSKNIAIGNYTYEIQNICTDYNFPLNVAIPENATNFTNFPLTVNDSFTLSDVNVKVNLTHPQLGSVYVAIRNPAQTTTIVRMVSAFCPGAANIDLIFDSAGTALDCANTTSGLPTIPQNSFDVFNGLNSEGSWTLLVGDAAVGDGNTGTLNNITLNLCQTGLAPVLKTKQFGLDGFAIYPNPNNGSFKIKFSSYANSDVKVVVNDLQGRQIYSEQFANNGLFEQDIQLKNVQSGIYLVTVADGGKKEVKRIVVR